MASVIARYTATVGQTDFPIPFSYNTSKPDTIKVTKAQSVLTRTTNYTIVNNTTVRMVTACVGGEYVVVELNPDFDNRPNNWQNTDTLTGAKHNSEDDEGLRRDQFLQSNAGLPRSRADDGWTAEDDNGDELVIHYVDDPVALTDAVNLRFLQNYVSGGSLGSPGAARVSATGDGTTTTYNILTAGQGQISDKNLVLAMFDGEVISPSAYTVTTDGLGITFTDPPGNGVPIDLTVVLAAIGSLNDGEILPAKIALANTNLIQGNASGFGAAVATTAIALSAFGAATSNLDIGSGGSDTSDTDASNKKLTHVQRPTNNADGATKKYVDDQDTASRLMSGTSATTLVFAGTTPSTGLQNSKAYTALVAITGQFPNEGNNRQVLAEIATDLAFTTPIVVGGMFMVSGHQGPHSCTIPVPTLYFWRLREVNTRDTSGGTFTYVTIN